ncbi:GrpB family protein [Chromobacterium piscinae]|uniref:GrpB family protein n=1 Tax=Chromobacterium piscinae TaxID=686831 RepID=UPI003F8102D4
MTETVTIIPHQARWTNEFEAVAARLGAALGSLALRIDHIGSTSVPGLAAKDVIDVQITVAELDENVLRSLGDAGFALKPFNREVDLIYLAAEQWAAQIGWQPAA